MARNKHPEETERKIVDVAHRLFMEKGYEHTTIQDIVDHLGMSKGAIYHHFKSKEDILDRITTGYYDRVSWFKNISADSEKTALEKLRQIIIWQLLDSEKLALDNMTLTMTGDPKLLALSIISSMKDAAPYMRKLLEEGLEDGSVSVPQPREFSETFMLMINVWLANFCSSEENFTAKMDFLQDFSEKMGFPLFDDKLRQAFLSYYRKILCQVIPPL